MSETGDSIARVALNYQGYDYCAAGTTPRCFDCSGFVRFVLKEVTGIVVSGDSHAQMKLGISVPRDKIEKGDILCFDTQNGQEVREGNRCSHVGISVGNNRMMNCLDVGLGCKVSDISSPYWNGEGARFLEARRFPGTAEQREPREPRRKRRKPCVRCKRELPRPRANERRRTPEGV